MRIAFAKTLAELAAHDPRIMLLTGDLGFMALESFTDAYPDRFMNVGVAEQNMVGIATGLAEAGFLPFTYSIVTFATLRPYEFIRNGPILHQLPVRIVGIGGGYEYGTAGPTHHGLEDIGVMRIQPGITVIAPADYEQTRTAILATWDLPGPIYYRLGKDDKTRVPGLDGRFELGRAQVIREGADLVLVAMGSIATRGSRCGYRTRHTWYHLYRCHCRQPQSRPSRGSRPQLLRSFPLESLLEAHYAVGGVGSLVAEVIAERGLGCRLIRHAVSETPNGMSGSQEYFYARHHLDRAALVESARTALAMVTA